MRRVSEHHIPILVGVVFALLLGLAMQGNALASPQQGQPLAVAQVPPCSPPICYGDAFYGANDSWMSLAIQKAGWPQKRDYWCGVANIAAINWYNQIKTFGTGAQPLWGTQASIGNDSRGYTTPSGTYYPPDSNDGVLNTNSAISPWGQASGSPAFKANIAGDSGTDPRSIAWGLYTVTPNNYYFHNWIYNTTNLTATYDFASDYGPTHGLNDPISVTINQGQHSFVIQGVYATSDPSAGGAVVDAIVTWDPLVGSSYGSYNSTNPQLYSRDTWLNYISPRGNVYWAKPYNTNNPAVSFQDPEPSTSNPYYNAPTQYVANHWNQRWVTIEQDTVTRCHGSPDIAYDENGNEVPHNGSAYCP